VNLLRKACGITLCLIALPLARTAAADDTVPVGGASNAPQPLWEVGIGAVAGTVADYPASDRYQARFVPFPYFIYRGHLFRSDENGAHLHTDVLSNVELDVSGGVSFATPSSSSGPRAGMPEIPGRTRPQPENHPGPPLQRYALAAGTAGAGGDFPQRPA